MHLKILLAGDGGQGIQLIADIVSEVVFQSGLYVTSISNYGLEQRGGASLNYIQISDETIGYSKFKRPDILVTLSKQGRDRVGEIEGEFAEYSYIQSEPILASEKINRGSLNIFFVGILAKILEEGKISRKNNIFEKLEKKLGNKPNWEENKKAFELGLNKI